MFFAFVFFRDLEAVSIETLVCNKLELAERLKCSRPTLDALLRRYPDFPVEQRGATGSAWQFKLVDVFAFLKAKKEEAVRAGAERASLFEQFRLPLDDLASPEAEGLSPQQRAALALARQREHDLALAAGQVVLAHEVAASDRTAWRNLGRFLDGLPAQLARFHNLPDAVVRSMRAQIDEERRKFVRETTADLLAEGAARRGGGGT